MPNDVEKLLLIFDFRNYSAFNAPPLHTSRYFLHVVTSHYPERLGAMLGCDAPWYFWTFYKLISPFIHPVTQSKIKFVNLKQQQQQREATGIWAQLDHHVDGSMLESDFGGRFVFDYQHGEYWPCLVAHWERMSA